MKPNLFVCMLIVCFSCLTASAQNPVAQSYLIYYGSSNTFPETYTKVDGIQDVDADDGIEVIYTIDGQRVNTLQQGINFIRMSDGKVKKVLVR